MRRRRCLQSIGALGTVGMSGCLGLGGNGDGSSDSLTYLGWGGNTQEAVKRVAEPWIDETGVDIELQSAGGNAEMLSVLENNPGSIDLVVFSYAGIYYAQQREADLLTEIDHSKVPNYESNMQEDWRSGDYLGGKALFRDMENVGFAYNANNVDEEPEEWSDILQEAYQGEVTLGDFPLYRFGNAAESLGESVNDIPNNEGLYQDVVDVMEQQNEQVFTYWSSGSEFVRLLRDESATIAEAWSGRILNLQREGNDHIKYVIPQNGSIGTHGIWAIPQSSERKETTYEFLNWINQRDRLIELSTDFGYPIPITDPPESITSLPGYTEDASDITVANLNNITDDMLSEWQREFESIKN